MKAHDALAQSRRRFIRIAGDAAAGLARARDFDAGTPNFGKVLTAAEVRRTLGLSS